MFSKNTYNWHIDPIHSTGDSIAGMIIRQEDKEPTICEDHLRTMGDDEMVDAMDNVGCGCEVK